MPLEIFERLGLALAIGFLVGVERGWRSRESAEGRRTAGIRTYALSGLLGGISGELAHTLGGWAFAAIAVPFAGAFVLFKAREQAEEGDYSVTAVVAGLIVFALGAYATVGDWRVAAGAAVTTTALLAFKGVLHGWLEKLTWPELRSALVLLAMSFVALPLLPNRGFGPFEAVNPYQIWMLTIALAGVSFIAYAAVKLFGAERGIVVAAAAGSLVSSTAVTLYVARQSREAPEALFAQVGAGLIAGAVMVGRMSVIAAVIAPVLLAHVAPALGAFALASLVIGAIAVWRGDHRAAAGFAPMKSPFDLGLVLKFGAVLGLVMAAAKIFSGLYGAQGLYPVAAAAGLVDVDAVTLTVSQLTAKGSDPQVGAYALLIAASVDSLSKAGIAAIVGGRRFGLLFGAGTLAALAAGAAALWLGPVLWTP